MDAFKQSMTALNLQSTPSSRAVQLQEPAQQLPIAILGHAAHSTRLVATSHLAILKSGLCIALRRSFTHNALASKIPQIEARGHDCRTLITMQDAGAGRYAEALVEIAQSNKLLETINEDVCKLSQLLQNQELYDFLVKPFIQAEKKKSILKAVADDAEFQPCTLNFLDFLVDKKRIDIIKDIMQEFDSIYNELTDTQVAVVSSALKLENYQMAQIARKIQRLSGATNVRLKNVIDPSLIAGFVISYGKNESHIIDMSVKGQLEKLAAQIDSAERVGACRESWSILNIRN
eukprot:Gb_24985 [translate_table: standard]